ncbi:hypothetical protein [Neptunitalea lumnitzerae]|uniref:Lipocalin-like domain-containing protein n=1 Tax=Neptunitalea lumnitzerae TaxID=2965509 RepID=A0ABQ5MLT8_9FLAO|nr:hypothetical protein [Neptunitalea sp. Y10]GLB50383.1 hypothetical protein Y10_27510 [Neptunitalea sp. Y10]
MKSIKLFFFISISFTILSCSNTITKANLETLNGYWEIEQVTTSDGSTKQYKVNTTVDYIEITDSLSGSRTKVNPSLDGTFTTNNNQEFFTLQQEGDHFIFKYKNALDEWQEELIDLDENHFTVKNPTGNTYYYKRYENITIE